MILELHEQELSNFTMPPIQALYFGRALGSPDGNSFIIDTTINTSVSTERTQNGTALTSESNDTIQQVMFSTCDQSCLPLKPTISNSLNSLTTGLNHFKQMTTQWMISPFCQRIQHKLVSEGDVIVYDVTAFLTNIPVEEAIQNLSDKAFKNDWFNNTMTFTW
ncbi:hypothetical protein ACROYT_G015269 [Oculina patagonica]